MNLLMTSSTILPRPAVSSDASLLAAAHQDPEAFRKLYERYAHAVNAYFVRRPGDRTAALDLTAETFGQAWLFAPGFETRPTDRLPRGSTASPTTCC
jgi:DNA-directed RNA polymerase specialized sigma24 family protein